MNQHYEDARSILSIRVPVDTLEGVVAMLETQAEATLALAYEQRTANLIAVLEWLSPASRDNTLKEISERLGLA